MPSKRSMIHTYLYSLIAMAVLPVSLLAYLWVSDLQREFEQQSQAWRRTYIETQKQALAYQVGDVIDNLEFERAGIDASQRVQLKLEVDNGIAQLESLRRNAGAVHSREQWLRRARDLLAPIRFGGGNDHFFIHSLDGTAILMPAYPQWEGQNIAARKDANGVDFVARFAELARREGEGYLEVWYNKRGMAGGAYLTMQYIRYYAPLDIYVGAVSYVDDLLAAVQREELARLASAIAGDGILTVIDNRGNVLLDRHQAAAPVPNDGEYWSQLRAANPAGDGFLQLQRTRPGTATAAPALVYLRNYAGWQWRVAASYFLDGLEAGIAQRRAALQQRIEQRIAQVVLIVFALIALAALVALSLAQRTRQGLRSFENFFAAANAQSSAIDVERLPFVEFERLALDANRMIAQRHRVETALRDSEQRFEMALRASACHLWEIDLDRHTVSMNGSLHQQLGYPQASREIDPERWDDIVHPDDIGVVQDSLQVLSDPAGRYNTEFRVRDSDGNYRWLLSRGAAVEFAADGRPVRALGTIIEITDRKRMEQELVAARIVAEDANHAKSQFLSSISHELRTPLNGVLGYAQILLRDEKISAEQQHNLRAIESCGQHLLTLINDVLDLAKIESGKIDIDEQPCDLYELLDSVSNIVRERVANKGLTYHLEIGASVPAVIRTDAVKLRQILVNLLGNAVKFTVRGDIAMKVIVHKHGSELLFSVSDTGVGIAEEKLREIFSPFHQVGKTTGGTGLGLSISQRLCEAMGGQLNVTSALGSGSCFSFSFPLKISARRLLAQPQHAERETIDTGGRRTTVMVVDDNQINRQVLGGMLRASGIDIVEAEHGLDALEQLRANPLPLVLMDVRMPVMDGFAATRAIKADPQLRDTVVVAVSASVFPDVVERMRAEGCDDFVSKPVRIGELLAVVAKYLQLPLRTLEQVAAPADDAAPQHLPKPLLSALRSAIAVGDIEAMRAVLRSLHQGKPALLAWARRIEAQLDHFDLDGARDLLASNGVTIE